MSGESLEQLEMGLGVSKGGLAFWVCESGLCVCVCVRTERKMHWLRGRCSVSVLKEFKCC